MGEIDISHQQSYQPIRSSVHSFTHSFIHPPVQQLYVLTIKCVPDIVPGVWGSQNLTSVKEGGKYLTWLGQPLIHSKSPSLSTYYVLGSFLDSRDIVVKKTKKNEGNLCPHGARF